MCEENYITIHNRIKDIIIRGGENIYPKELEIIAETWEGV
jgi:acyl-CoA synthetase (AMP-forming)/AMP-acid ligase II